MDKKLKLVVYSIMQGLILLTLFGEIVLSLRFNISIKSSIFNLILSQIITFGFLISIFFKKENS